MAEQQFVGFDATLYQPQPLPPPLGGSVRDFPNDSLADHQLASSMNFVVRNGVVTQRPGYETLLGSTGALTSTPMTMIEWVPYSQSARVVLGSLAALYYYDYTGDTWPTITGTARTGTVDNPIFFTPMRTASSGLRLITVNGVDPPAWWTGSTSTTFTYMTTAVIGACCVVWKSHFVQGDVTTSADGRVAPRVQWSALGDPTVWTGTASTGTLDLLDGNASRIMCFWPLRSQLLAYKEEGVHALVYKPSPFYFTQSLLHASLTTMSRRGIVPIENGDRHFVFSKNGLLIWDGQNLSKIGKRLGVDREILTTLNWSARETIWTAYWPETEEILIGIPTGSNTRPNRIWIFNLQHDSWWETDLDFLGASPIYNVFSPPRFLGAHPAVNKVYQLFTGLGDGTGGTAINSSLLTKLYTFGQPTMQKGLLSIGALIGPGTALTTTIGLQRAVTENPLLSTGLTFDSTTDLTVTAGSIAEAKADRRVTGKYLQLKICHSAAQETVQIHRLIPNVQPLTHQRKSR